MRCQLDDAPVMVVDYEDFRRSRGENSDGEP